MNRSYLFAGFVVWFLALLGLALVLFAQSTQAQAPLNARLPLQTATPTSTATPCPWYDVAQTTGATLVPGTTDVGNHCDDCMTTITLPFGYQLYDTTFTSASVSSNGNIQLASNSPRSSNTCLPAQDFTYAILPQWGDLVTDCSGCGVFTSVTGTSPNRIFNIEYRASFFKGLPINFEARLYEGQTRFDFVYGSIPTGGASATVGVQKDSTSFNEYECNTVGTLTDGTQLTWMLVPCSAPTGTSTPVGVSTSTPSATHTPHPGGTATASATPCTISFSDVHTSDYFYQAVIYLACHGAISGYSDGTFRPYNNTTRGQLSKIITLAEGWTIDTGGGPHFSDVPPSNPFYAYVETAYHQGVISGYSDGTFRWGNNVTRAQLCKIVVLAEVWTIDTTGGPHFSDVPPSDPFYGYVETAYHHSIITGYADGTFRPGNYATRGQICKIVYNAVTQP